MTKKLSWFDKWNRFFAKLTEDERRRLYYVLAGLRGPDSEDRMVKEWSRRLRDVLGFRTFSGGTWCCNEDYGSVSPQFTVLPEIKGLSHYGYHVFDAFREFDRLGVVV